MYTIKDLDLNTSKSSISETKDEISTSTTETLIEEIATELSTSIIESSTETIPETILTEVEVPTNINTSFKSYMDYRCITNVSSIQYQLQQQAYTDDKGLRKIGDDYCVALGTYYTSSCGERFEITLSNGNSFTVIVSDIKNDAHTDRTNRYNPLNGNVVEFIVDTNVLSNEVIYHGSVGHYEEFSGEIISVSKLT